MSCGRPIDEEEVIPTGPALAAACAKCNQPAVVLSQRTSYCQPCFMAAFTFKTRKGLDPARQASRAGSQSWQKRNRGKSRGLERDSVMVGFSGGPNSRALLDILPFFFPAADDASQTNAKFKPPPYFAGIEVIYVDESELDGFGPDRTDEVRAIVATTGFGFHSVKLSSLFSTPTLLSFSPSTSNLVAYPSTSTASPLSQLHSLLSPLPPTSRATLHSSLLSSLLRRTALARSHSTLLTGESATRLAIRTIASMALGRGASLGEEVGWEYETEEGLLVCRPLRGVMDAEVGVYNRARGLEWLEMKRVGERMEAKKAGIGAVSEEFVNGLEATFASTVSTILRTAHKLGLRSNHDRVQSTPTGTMCPLCGLPAQSGAETWRSAITISSLIDTEGCDAAVQGDAPKAEGTEGRALAPLLCYGCLLNWQGTQQAGKRPPPTSGAATEDDIVPLPAYVAEVAAKRWAQAENVEVVGERTIGVDDLRSEVEQFLL